MERAATMACLAFFTSCGSGTSPAPAGPSPCEGVTCSGHGSCAVVGGGAACTCAPGYVPGGGATCVASQQPAVGGCNIFPADHLFNTPIDGLPVHPDSAAFMATIGAHNLHLDLGQTVDQASPTYYGIPYNVVRGASIGWTAVRYSSTDPNMSWDPRSESDCALAGGSHQPLAPCTLGAAPSPVLPIPTSPLVEGGIVTDPAQPYGDHHILVVDADACRLWELYHCYPNALGGWDIFGSASWDLASSALRPAGWTSADAAGFPMLPLLLRADEAEGGTIRHALRFTIPSNKIRRAYVWPARHLTSNGTTSTSLPPMGQLFRLKASYAIPAAFGKQSRAILTALKTYGMYLSDGGSAMYIQGEPSAAWSNAIFSEVQSVGSAQFEAVDLAPVMGRPGFDPDSARVPPP